MVEYFVHGTHLAIDSAWSRFLEYFALNLSPFAARRETRDELRVEVSLRRKPWFPSAPEKPQLREGEERWSDDLSVDGRGVRFRWGGVELEFAIGPPPRVVATYLLDRRYRLASPFHDVPRWEEVQKVARLAVYLPLFHLWAGHGWTVLHAAAMGGRNGAVVLAGLNGSGKSTLCMNLLDRLRYMSDNYLIWTGSEVLGLPESPRIPLHRAPRSASRYPSVWGKRIVPLDPSRVLLSARPGALVFLTRGHQTSMVPIAQAEAVRRLEAIEDMTAEFPRYGYLGPLSPPRRPWASSLVDLVPSYALTVGDPSGARDRILQLADGAAT